MSKKFICDYKITGNGTPLFLIHGVGATKESWSSIIEELSNLFTVISYDLRGHGNSHVNKKDFTFDDLINDLENLRNHLGIKKAHFAGHSLGGMIAPMYSIKYPKRVIKIGMLSTVAGRSLEDKQKVLNVIKEMENMGIKNTLLSLTNRWFSEEFIKTRLDLVEARLKQVLATNSEVFINVFNIYAKTEIFSFLCNIIHPTLLLTGENDLGCSPKHNKKMSKQINKAKLVVIPKLKHSILIETPKQVAKYMIEFFK